MRGAGGIFMELWGCRGPKVLRGVLGVPWSEGDFADKACEVQHPMDSPPIFPDVVVRAAAWMASATKEQVAAHFEQVLHKWRVRAAELEEDEAALHASMPPHRAKVLEGKRLRLLSEMLTEIGHEDRSLVSDISCGFRLTGDLGLSGVFPERSDDDQQELVSKRWLWENAKEIRENIVQSAKRPSGDEALAQEVREISLGEAGRGWIHGPLSADEVSAVVGPLWVPSRRFGVVQGDKTRPVDDFSEGFVNASTLCREKLTLMSVDDLAGVCKLWYKLLDPKGFSVALGSGELLKGQGTREGAAPVSVVGKCFDLESAYKQFALHDADAAFAVIVGKSPGTKDEVELFVSRALPFGAVGPVVGFSRAAVAFRACIARIMWIPTLSYFDDYPCIVPDRFASLVDIAVKAFAGLLGWRLKGGSKDKAFSTDFDVLGIVAELGNVVRGGEVTLNNTTRRKLSMITQINEILARGSLGAAEAAQLAGRLGFASSQLFARIAAAPCWHLRRRAACRGMLGALPVPLTIALAAWREALRGHPPRSVLFQPPGQPIVLFTDGCCDPDLVGIGAVIVDFKGGVFETIGMRVPDAMVKEMHLAVGVQVITQVELLAVVAARRKWRRCFETPGTRVLIFVDNDAARFSLIKGYSPSLVSASLVALAAAEDADCQSFSWLDRLPSKSNCSDGPSRLDFSGIPDLFQGQVRIVAPPSLAGVLRHR